MKKAMFWKRLDDNLVQCQLCRHRCTIKKGGVGLCGVRKNNGDLESLVFGRAISAGIDPIEKKPFSQFMPGSKVLSVATMGCNFTCDFCQNYEISQVIGDIDGEHMPPEELIRLSENVDGFAWTYTEPTVFFEYFYETAQMLKKQGIKKFHTWVTNGYTTEEAIREAAKYVKAVNIDFKGDDEFYRSLCGAKLDHVKEAMKVWKEQKVWIEITNLLIPKQNAHNVAEMSKWIADNLGEDTPLHISAYHPAHKLTDPATQKDELLDAYNTAKGFLKYVYIGNMTGDKEHTHCPECEEIVIERHGYGMTEVRMNKKISGWKCQKCGSKIAMG